MARDLLDDSSSESATSSDNETVKLSINQEFAQRFEHNKKREELQKLEEKLGTISKKRKRDNGGLSGSESGSSSGSSSESEDEDDVGELATASLDSEILATLNAIKAKDPRVYDGKTTFYTGITEKEVPEKEQEREKADKPMYLRDYHRQTLLDGHQANDFTEPITYHQGQNQLKESIISEMHAAVNDSSEDEELLVAKKRDKTVEPTLVLDVENAEKDPEMFLSNFMASRAWVPNEKSTWQPLESDDEDEERRADAYEEAYNMRFEDPNKSNETLRTHARDIAAKYSVRRVEKNSRHRKRDEQREQRELEKQQKREEKARLRKLRVEEVEEKVRKIKKAAGIKTSDLQPEDWSHFVDEEWDSSRWEEEMQRRFNEEYYAEEDADSGNEEQNSTKRKSKKPKFEDDIDIVDIVPNFNADEAEFSLTDENDLPKKNHKQKKEEKRRESKKERRIIEQLVGNQLQLELDDELATKSAGFRYRDTSPQSFGLTSQDILMANDSQLNEFIGLKKLATFRDPERKLKDRKHLGKKGRLREWRKATFGNADSEQDPQVNESRQDGEAGTKVASKNRRRSKRRKILE